MVYVCPQCNREFERAVGKVQNQKNIYCSRACRDESRRKTINKICLICGKKYPTIPAHAESTKYCSKKCFHIGKTTGRFKECEICGKEFWAFKSAEERSGAKFCSWYCYTESVRNPELNPLSRENCFRTWAPLVKERDNYTCQKCGSEEELHAHHILSWCDYTKERFNIENGLTLCAKCHIKIHRTNIIE